MDLKGRNPSKPLRLTKPDPRKMLKELRTEARSQHSATL